MFPLLLCYYKKALFTWVHLEMADFWFKGGVHLWKVVAVGGSIFYLLIPSQTAHDSQCMVVWELIFLSSLPHPQLSSSMNYHACGQTEKNINNFELVESDW